MQALSLGVSVIVALLAVLILYQFKTSTTLTTDKIKSNYDYIIVGGGTCGCILAGKLVSESNKSVLLVEAGGEFNFLASVPIMATFLQRSKFDWAFRTTTQLYSSAGLHQRKQAMPLGKGLGGSGQINYMVYTEPQEQDFGVWEKEYNITKWNYKNLEKYFKNVRKRMHVREIEPTILSEAFKTAVSHQQFHAFSTKTTIFNGHRWSTYEGYLKPNLKLKNLHILPQTSVKKIIFSKSKSLDSKYKAIGIETDSLKNPLIYAKEIIVSAGSIQTPQILMLSGIGPLETLNKYNISPIFVNEFVGKNLHDHLNMPTYIEIEQPVSITTNKILSLKQVWKYFVERSGLFTSIPIMGVARTKNVGILLFGMGSTDEKIFSAIANYKTETFRDLFPFHLNGSKEGFLFLTSCVSPTSRGEVFLQSNNYQSHPKINPRYLHTEDDLQCMINGLKIIQKLVKHEVFQELGAKIHWPHFSDENCEKSLEGEAYLQCIVRTGALTGYHPGGTCMMGHRNNVVDENLRVKGVEGLRIVDASLLPTAISQFPYSLLMALAERAADLILNKSD